ncbi:response regulator transcription factor [Streptomyces apocyni]|uniref:response regulator transcription factor n=1 Tax=Streptomyces apocyni TaxID=2654677 RepID=UPI001E5CF907|nr:response regulator transcription factor [Streptomyces apocyni]
MEVEGGPALTPCDVLVVDIDRLEEVHDPVPVAAVTYGAEMRHPGLLEADVRAIVDRDDLDDAFLEAVHEVAAGNGWISPTLVRPLLRGPHTAHSAHSAEAAQQPAHTAARVRRRDPALTAREYEVVSLVTQGMNNSEIAGALYIAESTVKFHMSNILQKTGFRDRSQLAARVPTRVPARVPARLSVAR